MNAPSYQPRYSSRSAEDQHRLSNWLLGIAAVLVTTSIVFGAATLYRMNAQLAVIDYRLSAIEHKIGE
jgi:hypothetical protein